MRLPILMFTVVLTTACATRPEQLPSQPEVQKYPEEGAISEAGEFPAESTDETYSFPWEITGGTAPSTGDTRPDAPPRLSPPAIGAEDLAMLPEAANPARGASLNLTQQGRLAYMNRDYVAARQRLQSALQVWGSNAWAKYYLGLVDLAEGNYAPAAVFAKAATRQFKQYPFWSARAYFLLGESLERLGRREEAATQKAAAYELDPRVELR